MSPTHIFVLVFWLLILTVHAFPPPLSCLAHFHFVAQVTWPAYFVELVRAVEEHRRREEEKALAELEGESDGVLSGEESDDGSDAGSKSAADGRGSDGEGAKWGRHEGSFILFDSAVSKEELIFRCFFRLKLETKRSIWRLAPVLSEVQ